MNRFNFENKDVSFVIHEDGDFDVFEDIRSVNKDRNYLCKGGSRRSNVIYEDVIDKNVVWQVDVYYEVEKYAKSVGVNRIVDVGCGNGEKLDHYFPSSDYQTIGVDFHGSLTLSREKYPSREWLEADLTSYRSLEQLNEEIRGSNGTIFILSDVIEHLTDPRPLLSWLRTALMLNVKNRLFISTPDRARQGYLTDDCVPANDAHIREWDLNELKRLMASSGFGVEKGGYTRSNQFDTEEKTLIIVCKCDQVLYIKFLKRNKLIYDDQIPNHLLITREYAPLRKTGGIGTFVYEQRILIGKQAAICLFVDSDFFDPARLEEEECLDPSFLFYEEDIVDLPNEEVFLICAEQIFFFMPTIKTIQYADYQGEGVRISQAINAGFLPSKVKAIVHCHGATHYLENANQTWYGDTHIGVAEKEKLSVELADLVCFPTQFLHDLYLECGFKFVQEKIIKMRYPFRLEVQTKGAFCNIIDTAIDTIVFYGKRSGMKGFSLFLEAILKVSENVKELSLKRIIVIGPDVSSDPEDGRKLDRIRELFAVDELRNASRSDALSIFKENANRAICVMPYLGDNHPYALLDVIYAAMLPLTVDAGGIKEIIGTEFQKSLVALPNAPSIAEKLINLLSINKVELDKLRLDFLISACKEQENINSQNKNFFESDGFGIQRYSLSKKTVSLIVPVFNTDLGYISDLIEGLNRQSRLPDEIIFIDDASSKSYSKQLEALVNESLEVNHRIVVHEKNKGLSGARNTGLKESKSDVLINIDSDDVPLNDFVKYIIETFERNPDVSAVVPYLEAFKDGYDYNLSSKSYYVYRPIGEGVIASILDNNLGHANSGYSRQALLDLGGWDESEKSMWEDWALYLKLASSGAKILVIPKVLCLYRVRDDSMLRTYKQWPAMKRLSNNLLGLSRFENYRLQAMMRSYRDISGKYNTLYNHSKELEIRNENLVKVTGRTSSRISIMIADLLTKNEYSRKIFIGFFSIAKSAVKKARKV